MDVESVTDPYAKSIPGERKFTKAEALPEVLTTFTVSARDKLPKEPIFAYLRNNYGNIPLREIDSVFGFVERSTLYGGRVFQKRELSGRDVMSLNNAGIGLRIPMSNHFADPGSSFSRVGQLARSGNAKVVIQEINGTPIHQLSDLIAACTRLRDGDHTYVVVRDFNLFNSSPTPKSLTLNLKFGPLKVFDWKAQELDWEETKIPDTRSTGQ